MELTMNIGNQSKGFPNQQHFMVILFQVVSAIMTHVHSKILRVLVDVELFLLPDFKVLDWLNS